jgi:hypothetical protein
MEQHYSIRQNRLWIISNYASLVLFLILFYLSKELTWARSIIAVEVILFILFLFSFRRAFVLTNFWKMVHSAKNRLDEREMQVVLNALKNSYVIFTIVCLLIIYGFAVAEKGPVDVIIAAGLIYLAHTLPAAVVGWHEKMFIPDYD